MEKTKIQIEDMECFTRITINSVENDQQQEKLFLLLFSNLFFFIGLFIVTPKFYRDVLLTEFSLKNEFIILVFLVGAIISLYYFILASKVFIWQVAGEEVYEVFPDKLKITKTTFTIGKTREYLREEISGVTVQKPRTLSMYSISKFYPIDIYYTGLIFVARKGKQPIILGMGLNWHEAEKIAQVINKYLFPRNDKKEHSKKHLR